MDGVIICAGCIMHSLCMMCGDCVVVCCMTRKQTFVDVVTQMCSACLVGSLCGGIDMNERDDDSKLISSQICFLTIFLWVMIICCMFWVF